jgi:hypothetical protein
MNKKKFVIDWGKAMQKIKEQENSKGGDFKDERFFKPQFKEDGTFQAVIRFLPSKDTDIPFIELYTHGFKGPGGWYVDNCPTTLKRKCPVCDANSAIWDDYPDTVRLRKRKLSYYSNILVVNDIQTPANNGKVFLWRYGKKVHDKIMQKWQPPEGGILKPITVFDYYEGANFNLMIKKVKVGKEFLPNYDESGFESVSCIGTDEEIEKIHNSLFGLKEFNAESSFKSYEELKEKHDKVIGQIITTNEKSEKSIERVATHTPVTTVSKTSEVAAVPEEQDTGDIFSGTDESFFEGLQTE